MNSQPYHHLLIKPFVMAIAMLPTLVTAETKSLSEADTLLHTVGDPNDTKLMKDLGLTIGGWVNAGVTYNSTDPADNFNGPVTFGDRASELQLNQLNFFMQRAVATEGDAWDFGGRVDVMFGTDALFTQAYGVPGTELGTGTPLNRGHWDLRLVNERFYNLAIPQAYLEAYVPVGNGLNVKAGHFYTPIGYETVPAPDNFFYTHAYTMQYGEPFTHTGFLGNYTVDKNWAIVGGAVTGSATGGWDGGWDQQLGNWSGIMGATWTSNDENTSFNITGTYGGRSEISSDSWAMYSMVFKHNFLEKFHWVLQHDHGFADQIFAANGQLADATWYGVNTHLYYDIKDDLAVGVRGEWFRDQNGVRVCSPGRTAASCAAGSYYEVTAGVTWKPLKWLNVRPNVRYDWADGARPFDAATKGDQFLFSTDITMNF
jgi:hypothetical protein